MSVTIECLHSRTRPLYIGAKCVGRQCRLCGMQMFASLWTERILVACARLGFEDPAELEAKVRALVGAVIGLYLPELPETPDDHVINVPRENRLWLNLAAALAPFKEAPHD